MRSLLVEHVDRATIDASEVLLPRWAIVFKHYDAFGKVTLVRVHRHLILFTSASLWISLDVLFLAFLVPLGSILVRLVILSVFFVHLTLDFRSWWNSSESRWDLFLLRRELLMRAILFVLRSGLLATRCWEVLRAYQRSTRRSLWLVLADDSTVDLMVLRLTMRELLVWKVHNLSVMLLRLRHDLLWERVSDVDIEVILRLKVHVLRRVEHRLWREVFVSRTSITLRLSSLWLVWVSLPLLHLQRLQIALLVHHLWVDSIV